MKLNRLFIGLGFCLSLAACSGSDSSNGSPGKDTNPQSAIRLQEIPSQDLGAPVQLSHRRNEFNVGIKGKP